MQRWALQVENAGEREPVQLHQDVQGVADVAQHLGFTWVEQLVDACGPIWHEQVWYSFFHLLPAGDPSNTSRWKRNCEVSGDKSHSFHICTGSSDAYNVLTYYSTLSWLTLFWTGAEPSNSAGSPWQAARANHQASVISEYDYYIARFPNILCLVLQEWLSSLLDITHSVLFQWSTPSEILQSFQAQELWIAPPQFYELSRMCHFPVLLDLHNFSSKRASEGCEHWLPVLSKDERNRLVSLLPGIKCLPHQLGSLTDLLKHAKQTCTKMKLA